MIPPPTSTLPISDTTVCHCPPHLEKGNNTFTLYTEGDDLYAAMLEEIDGAKKEIYLETYIFSADEIGQRFADKLAARATEGLQVCLMVDAWGSSRGLPRTLERSLRQAGVQTRRFHRWRWKDPLRYNRRDHRKLLVVDGRAAFLGGFNIHRECSRKIYGERRWRDSHVRLTGPLATAARELFTTFWDGDPLARAPEVGDGSSVLLSNHTRACRLRLYCTLRDLFSGAKKSLSLTTPYFVPSHAIRIGLQAAATRGVTTRLLIPRVSDVPLAQWAARAVYGEMINAGIRVYEYQPRFLHAKTIIADDEYTLLGTANLDYRSLFLNHELVLASRESSLTNALQQQFEADLSDAIEVCTGAWKHRRWSDRLAEELAWALRHWL